MRFETSHDFEGYAAIRLRLNSARDIPTNPPLGCEMGRKFLPGPLRFGSRRVGALGKPVPLGLGRVGPGNPAGLTGGDGEVESEIFRIF